MQQVITNCLLHGWDVGILSGNLLQLKYANMPMVACVRNLT